MSTQTTNGVPPSLEVLAAQNMQTVDPTTDRLAALANAVKDAPVTRSRGRHATYTRTQLEAFALRLASGETFTNDEFPVYPVESDGSYADPYICAYYPLHTVRTQLSKAGLIPKQLLAIGQTDKTGTACKLRYVGKRI